MGELTVAQELKLRLLGEGLRITEAARGSLDAIAGASGLTSADYASTSGPILALEDDVWVNAPVADHNANFVTEAGTVLDVDSDGFTLEGRDGLACRARFWPQPSYHGRTNEFGPLTHYVVTHGDRARLSPLRSCAMTCEFCNIPYEDPIQTYALKPLDGCLTALRVALADPAQPAHHVLISGGTPKPKDVGFHRELYRRVLTEFRDVDVDIMMAPVEGVFDVAELAAYGVRDLSINIEVFDRDRAKAVARQKFHQGLQHYLDVIEQAAATLGPGRVRSMLLVGLESRESTLAGCEAILRRGGVPVLSPFRPDPVTPMRDVPPPTAEELRESYLRARDLAAAYGGFLGPDCPPCTHNTLGFGADATGQAAYRYPHPVVH
jgi:hypothetical protein